jgi:hypothetical protein
MDLICNACPQLTSLTYVVSHSSTAKVPGSRLIKYLPLLTNLLTLEINLGECSRDDICLTLIGISTSRIHTLEKVTLLAEPNKEGSPIHENRQSWYPLIPRLILKVPRTSALEVAKCLHVGVEHLQIYATGHPSWGPSDEVSPRIQKGAADTRYLSYCSLFDFTVGSQEDTQSYQGYQHLFDSAV